MASEDKSADLHPEEALIKASDELLIDYLESMENYMRSALDEEKLLKEGFINIAHARMCMKPNLISLEGFPNETTEDFSAATTISTSSNVPGSEFYRTLNTDPSRDLELRRLFGRSTPASLKNAQAIFQRVLTRALERANIVRELEVLNKKGLDLNKKLKIVRDKEEKENVSGLGKLSVSG